MQKVRKIIFILAVAVVMFTVVGYKALLTTGFMTQSTTSSLEGRAYQTFPKISAKSLSEGDFQEQFQQYISDLIPMRDSVLLANAKVQRTMIAASNVPFGFEAFPSFYGSKYNVVPGWEMACENPASKSEYSDSVMSSITEALQGLIDDHCDAEWYVYIPDRAKFSLELPAHDYVSDPADYDYLMSYMNELEGCTVLDGSCPSVAELAATRFHTDHHWQVTGAQKAYAEICEAMRVAAQPLEEAYKACGETFYGAGARNGLCDDYGDEVLDVDFDGSGLSVFVDESQKAYSALDSNTGTPYLKSNRFSNVYADWFHADYGFIVIDNPNAPLDETLFIFADSFSNNCERFYSSNYKKVVAYDARRTTVTPKEALDMYDPDRVLFMITFEKETVDKFIAPL